ncbi:MAG: hydrolase, partial [Microcystis sp. M_QC_C_20170808_M3Col]
FFGKIGCNGRFFVFLDKNNYFFKKTLFYFFVGYFILWKSLTLVGKYLKGYL